MDLVMRLCSQAYAGIKNKDSRIYLLMKGSFIISHPGEQTVELKWL